MSWLDRIDERHARRMARSIQANALQTRDLAQDQLAQFAHQARALAKPVLHQAKGKRDSAQDHLSDFAHQARALAEPALHDAVDYARHEGVIVARAAAKQAMRAGRAVKADPVPTIVGVVAVALLASLVFGRKRT